MGYKRKTKRTEPEKPVEKTEQPQVNEQTPVEKTVKVEDVRLKDIPKKYHKFY
jgi:hypothetical protein